MGVDLLLPALGGYWLLTHLNLTKYGALRSSGYHIFFRSFCVGIFLLVISQVLISFSPKIVDFVFQGLGISVSKPIVVSLALGLLLPLPFNWFLNDKEAGLRDAKERGELMEIVFSRSLNNQELVEFSLSGGESYIGFVVERKIGERSGSDVALVPFASGYRNKDTRELVITASYVETISDFKKASRDLGDLQIVIPVSEIVFARFFDSDLYEKRLGEDGEII